MPPPADGTAVPQPKPKVKLTYDAPAGSRASSLLAQLPRLESEARDAAQKLEECKKALMSEIAATVEDPANMPDGWSIAADPYGAWPAYNLTSSPGKLGLDTETMKAQEPDTYARFVKRGKPFWTFSRVQRNRVHRG
jgi:hypothetical protein